jgi:hypothetical protein
MLDSAVVRQVAEAVAPVDDGVEALLGQRAKIALLEAGGYAALGGQPSRLRHLLRGDVDAHDAKAPLGEPKGDPTGAARGVEHVCCGGQVEQGGDGAGLLVGPGLGGRPPELGLQAGVEADEPVVGEVRLHFGYFLSAQVKRARISAPSRRPDAASGLG